VKSTWRGESLKSCFAEAEFDHPNQIVQSPSSDKLLFMLWFYPA